MARGTYDAFLGRGGAHLRHLAGYLDEIWDAIGGMYVEGSMYFVDPSGGSDDFNGLTPTTAKITTQAAIDDGEVIEQC